MRVNKGMHQSFKWRALTSQRNWSSTATGLVNLPAPFNLPRPFFYLRPLRWISRIPYPAFMIAFLTSRNRSSCHVTSVLQIQGALETPSPRSSDFMEVQRMHFGPQRYRTPSRVHTSTTPKQGNCLRPRGAPISMEGK